MPPIRAHFRNNFSRQECVALKSIMNFKQMQILPFF